MITPTGATIAQYWQAIKDGCVQHCRMTFDNNIVLDDSDINQSGMELMDIINGATDLTIGAAVMKTLSMKLFVNNKTRNIVWGSEFTLEFGVEIGGTTNWITVGTFTGERPDQYPVNDIFEVSACDRMQKFDIVADDFLSNITYPITFGSMYHDLCTFVGVQYDAGDELANIMSRSFTASPLASGMTCRDILGLMAEACGCYAKITPAGHVKMVWFADASSYSVPADEEFRLSAMNIERGRTWEWMEQYTWEDLESMTWDDIATYNDAMTIDALSVKSSNDDIGVIVPSSGTRKNVYYIIENPFLYNETDQDVEDYIEPIYTRLNAFGSYLPMNVECTGNWLVESGDIITVDFKGESIKLPIFARTLQWRGSCKDTYEATGRLQRDSMSVPTHEKLTQMGRFHEIKVTIDGNYEKIQDQFGNYYTKSETATYVSTQLSTALGDYYTKTETATYVSTQMSTALGDYYTKTETASQISTYVGNNAYGKVSGITITSSGIDLTGSQYIKLTSGNTYMQLSPSGIDFTGTVAHFTTPAGYVCGINGFNFSRTTISSHYVYRATAYDVDGSTDLLYLTANTNGIIIDSNGSFVFYPSNQNTYGISIVKDGNYARIIGTSAVKLGDPSLGKISLTYADTIYYTTLIQNSSRDIKHDIQPLEDVGDKVDALNPVTFVYDDDVNEQRRMGMIYEDTVEVMPEICTGDESEKAINYVELIPVLLKEIQSLRARVKELEV